MSRLKRALRWLFLELERGLDAAFGVSWNPFAQLGALGFFFYWIVAVSGIYVYICQEHGIASNSGDEMFKHLVAVTTATFIALAVAPAIVCGKSVTAALYQTLLDNEHTMSVLG